MGQTYGRSENNTDYGDQFEARYDGSFCKVCDEAIIAGTRIVRHPRGGYAHAVCPPKQSAQRPCDECSAEYEHYAVCSRSES